MATFKESRNLLLESYNEGVIEEEEYEDYDRFDLANVDPTECKAEFRLVKNMICLFLLKLWEFQTCLNVDSISVYILFNIYV